MKKVMPIVHPLLLTAATVVTTYSLLQVAPAQAVNLIANGNFATGDFSSWTQPLNTDVSNVFVSNGDNGTKTAFLGPLTTEFLSQTLSTVAGTSYQITYDLLSTAGTNSFETRVNNTVLFAPTNIAVTDPFFNSYSFSYIGTGSDKLEFRFKHDSYFQLDNVVFDGRKSTSVPEPLTILGTIFGGSAALKLRSKLKFSRKV